MSKAAVFRTVLSITAGAAIGWFARGMFGGGGGAPPAGMMNMPPPAVRVMTARETLLTPSSKYIAQVEPLQEVLVRPQVSGLIEQVHFTEGSIVGEGDLLFSIDPSSYQAIADAAEADMERTRKLYERLKRADARSVSASDLETAESNYLRAKAACDLAMVDLNYTQIKAPVSGRIGTAMVKKGNYVTSSTEGLARIVQIDPIRIVFSQTDREYLTMRRTEQAGNPDALEARVLLPDGSLLPEIGKKDFNDNVINPDTGTIAVRYLFDNPDGLLLPGAIVTAQISNPAGHKGIRIPQRAILIDQEGAYVLTVDETGAVGMARLTVGDQIGGNVTVIAGLKPGDRIIVDGVQKARPGATVQALETEVSE